MVNYNCVFLDLDGTVWDFEKAEHTALLKTLEKYNIEPTKENIDKYIEINSGLWKALELNQVKKEELVIERFRRFLEFLNMDGNAENMNYDYLTSLSQQGDLLPKARQTVAELAKETILVAVTNGVERVQMGRLVATGFDKYLKSIYVSEKVGVAKPNREIFDYVLKDLGIIDTSKVLVVGDSLGADIAGGNNAQLDTCWVNFKGIENKTGIEPKFTITNFEQLKKLILG